MEYYTVYVDGELWTNVVDDMNRNASWGIGGMLWSERQYAIDFGNHLKSHIEWKDSTVSVRCLLLKE